MRDLSAAGVAAALETERLGRSLVVLEETASTMDDARAALDAGVAEGHVVVADRQRAGRGSRGRSWSSPSGAGLWFSVALREVSPMLTLATGLAVADEVTSHVAPEVRIKWPNDVYVGGRKIAGILVETRSRGARIEGCVVGVGVNVGRRTFPPEVEATSLALEGVEVTRSAMLASLLGRMERWYARLAEPAAVVRALDARLLWRGERVRCDEVVGVLRGVAEDGALRIGDREVRAGRLERCP